MVYSGHDSSLNPRPSRLARDVVGLSLRAQLPRINRPVSAVVVAHAAVIAAVAVAAVSAVAADAADDAVAVVVSFAVMATIVIYIHFLSII